MADERRYTSVMVTTAEGVLKEALQLSEGERKRVEEARTRVAERVSRTRK